MQCVVDVSVLCRLLLPIVVAYYGVEEKKLGTVFSCQLSSLTLRIK